jgi:hypothetical protein
MAWRTIQSTAPQTADVPRVAYETLSQQRAQLEGDLAAVQRLVSKIPSLHALKLKMAPPPHAESIAEWGRECDECCEALQRLVSFHAASEASARLSGPELMAIKRALSLSHRAVFVAAAFAGVWELAFSHGLAWFKESRQLLADAAKIEIENPHLLSMLAEAAMMHVHELESSGRFPPGFLAQCSAFALMLAREAAKANPHDMAACHARDMALSWLRTPSADHEIMCQAVEGTVELKEGDLMGGIASLVWGYAAKRPSGRWSLETAIDYRGSESTAVDLRRTEVSHEAVDPSAMDAALDEINPRTQFFASLESLRGRFKDDTLFQVSSSFSAQIESLEEEARALASEPPPNAPPPVQGGVVLSQGSRRESTRLKDKRDKAGESTDGVTRPHDVMLPLLLGGAVAPWDDERLLACSPSDSELRACLAVEEAPSSPSRAAPASVRPTESARFTASWCTGHRQLLAHQSLTAHHEANALIRELSRSLGLAATAAVAGVTASSASSSSSTAAAASVGRLGEGAHISHEWEVGTICAARESASLCSDLIAVVAGGWLECQVSDPFDAPTALSSPRGDSRQLDALLRFGQSIAATPIAPSSSAEARASSVTRDERAAGFIEQWCRTSLLAELFASLSLHLASSRGEVDWRKVSRGLLTESHVPARPVRDTVRAVLSQRFVTDPVMAGAFFQCVVALQSSLPHMSPALFQWATGTCEASAHSLMTSFFDSSPTLHRAALGCVLRHLWLDLRLCSLRRESTNRTLALAQRVRVVAARWQRAQHGDAPLCMVSLLPGTIVAAGTPWLQPVLHVSDLDRVPVDQGVGRTGLSLVSAQAENVPLPLGTSAQSEWRKASWMLRNERLSLAMHRNVHQCLLWGVGCMLSDSTDAFPSTASIPAPSEHSYQFLAKLGSKLSSWLFRSVVAGSARSRILHAVVASSSQSPLLSASMHTPVFCPGIHPALINGTIGAVIRTQYAPLAGTGMAPSSSVLLGAAPPAQWAALPVNPAQQHDHDVHLVAQSLEVAGCVEVAMGGSFVTVVDAKPMGALPAVELDIACADPFSIASGALHLLNQHNDRVHLCAGAAEALVAHLVRTRRTPSPMEVAAARNLFREVPAHTSVPDHRAASLSVVAAHHALQAVLVHLVCALGPHPLEQRSPSALRAAARSLSCTGHALLFDLHHPSHGLSLSPHDELHLVAWSIVCARALQSLGYWRAALSIIALAAGGTWPGGPVPVASSGKDAVAELATHVISAVRSPTTLVRSQRARLLVAAAASRLFAQARCLSCMQGSLDNPERLAVLGSLGMRFASSRVAAPAVNEGPQVPHSADLWDDLSASLNHARPELRSPVTLDTSAQLLLEALHDMSAPLTALISVWLPPPAACTARLRRCLVDLMEATATTATDPRVSLLVADPARSDDAAGFVLLPGGESPLVAAGAFPVSNKVRLHVNGAALTSTERESEEPAPVAAGEAIAVTWLGPAFLDGLMGCEVELCLSSPAAKQEHRLLQLATAMCATVTASHRVQGSVVSPPIPGQSGLPSLAASSNGVSHGVSLDLPSVPDPTVGEAISVAASSAAAVLATAGLEVEAMRSGMDLASPSSEQQLWSRARALSCIWMVCECLEFVWRCGAGEADHHRLGSFAIGCLSQGERLRLLGDPSGSWERASEWCGVSIRPVAASSSSSSAGLAAATVVGRASSDGADPNDSVLFKRLASPMSLRQLGSGVTEQLAAVPLWILAQDPEALRTAESLTDLRVTEEMHRLFVSRAGKCPIPSLDATFAHQSNVDDVASFRELSAAEWASLSPVVRAILNDDDESDADEARALPAPMKPFTWRICAWRQSASGHHPWNISTPFWAEKVWRLYLPFIVTRQLRGREVIIRRSDSNFLCQVVSHTFEPSLHESVNPMLHLADLNQWDLPSGQFISSSLKSLANHPEWFCWSPDMVRGAQCLSAPEDAVRLAPLVRWWDHSSFGSRVIRPRAAVSGSGNPSLTWAHAAALQLASGGSPLGAGLALREGTTPLVAPLRLLLLPRPAELALSSDSTWLLTLERAASFACVVAAGFGGDDWAPVLFSLFVGSWGHVSSMKDVLRTAIASNDSMLQELGSLWLGRSVPEPPSEWSSWHVAPAAEWDLHTQTSPRALTLSLPRKAVFAEPTSAGESSTAARKRPRAAPVEAAVPHWMRLAGSPTSWIVGRKGKSDPFKAPLLPALGDWIASLRCLQRETMASLLSSQAILHGGTVSRILKHPSVSRYSMAVHCVANLCGTVALCDLLDTKWDSSHALSPENLERCAMTIVRSMQSCLVSALRAVEGEPLPPDAATVWRQVLVSRGAALFARDPVSSHSNLDGLTGKGVAVREAKLWRCIRRLRKTVQAMPLSPQAWADLAAAYEAVYRGWCSLCPTTEQLERMGVDTSVLEVALMHLEEEEEDGVPARILGGRNEEIFVSKMALDPVHMADAVNSMLLHRIRQCHAAAAAVTFLGLGSTMPKTWDRVTPRGGWVSHDVLLRREMHQYSQLFSAVEVFTSVYGLHFGWSHEDSGEESTVLGQGSHFPDESAIRSLVESFSGPLPSYLKEDPAVFSASSEFLQSVWGDVAALEFSEARKLPAGSAGYVEQLKQAKLIAEHGVSMDESLQLALFGPPELVPHEPLGPVLREWSEGHLRSHKTENVEAAFAPRKGPYSVEQEWGNLYVWARASAEIALASPLFDLPSWLPDASESIARMALLLDVLPDKTGRKWTPSQGPWCSGDASVRAGASLLHTMRIAFADKIWGIVSQFQDSSRVGEFEESLKPVLCLLELASSLNEHATTEQGILTSCVTNLAMSFVSSEPAGLSWTASKIESVSKGRHLANQPVPVNKPQFMVSRERWGEPFSLNGALWESSLFCRLALIAADAAAGLRVLLNDASSPGAVAAHMLTASNMLFEIVPVIARSCRFETTAVISASAPCFSLSSEALAVACDTFLAPGGGLSSVGTAASGNTCGAWVRPLWLERVEVVELMHVIVQPQRASCAHPQVLNVWREEAPEDHCDTVENTIAEFNLQRSHAMEVMHRAARHIANACVTERCSEASGIGKASWVASQWLRMAKCMFASLTNPGEGPSAGIVAMVQAMGRSVSELSDLFLDQGVHSHAATDKVLLASWFRCLEQGRKCLDEAMGWERQWPLNSSELRALGDVVASHMTRLKAFVHKSDLEELDRRDDASSVASTPRRQRKPRAPKSAGGIYSSSAQSAADPTDPPEGSKDGVIETEKANSNQVGDDDDDDDVVVQLDWADLLNE